MARAQAILQSQFPYHITGRCINREWFHLHLELVWSIFSEELYVTSKIYNLQIHSFVLMSNHFHLIASTPDANISQCLHRLIGVVSRRLNECGNRINGTFAGRHFKTILQHPNYFLNTYKYVYRNPIAAGLCQRAEEYPYSTLYGLLGQAYLIIPVLEDTTLFSDVEGTLQWLNTTPNSEHWESVRYALKRSYFQPRKNREDGKVTLTLNDLI
ncbi:transposase [Pseudobdellovibrio exovorus]|uniref:Transposase IS200-like domain-containing protein n=1 Tax=Pseudobdellovibrio exovorus JSS TaxID=1184267 RepID=M4VBB9_9BACT|nr:transposase [Pseudobdellovibrio exovorus]AGH96692.1 hypothetical protein A11Q_2476 [Pseudobdellovibrio exovorus JSS]